MMARSNFPAPAIPVDVILPRIIQQCLCEGDAWNLALESNFVNVQFRAHQIYCLHTSAFSMFHKRLAVKVITHAFDVQPKDVRRPVEKADAISRARGEHPALEEDIEQQLIDWIMKNVQNHTAVNRTELLHYYRETFGAAVTAGCVDSLLLRHELGPLNTIGRPQEHRHLNSAFVSRYNDGISQ
jgi:hypothetical protein